MKNKVKKVFIALLLALATTTTVAACNSNEKVVEVPTDKEYTFTNPDGVYASPDEGFTIDGKADEDVYKNSKWVSLHNQNGTNTVDLAMTSYFGENGMYFVYDVTENTPVYVNHARASYINSGIEMYFAPQGVTSMSNDNVYEIDIEADGKVTFKKSAGYSSQWTNVGSTSDIMAYARSMPKGGAINSGECFGYTLEFFIPWDYIEWLGMAPETIKEETVSVNPVHITSYNYNGTDHTVDRYWYSFATQLGGDGWNHVGQYFKFDKNGVSGTASVTMGEGTHCTISGPTAVIPGLPITITVTPEQGYAVNSLKSGDDEMIKFANYNDDGSATYTTVGVDSGLYFSATAEEVTAGNKNLTGKISLKKAGGDTFDGLSASYFDADGEHTLTLNNDGNFALNDLPQGYYKIAAEKTGYGKIVRTIYLNRNIETQIDLEYGTFEKGDGSCWDIANENEGYVIKKGGRGSIISKNSYGTVYADAIFLYDETLAASSTNNDDKEQRAGIRTQFSGGKSWSITVICSGGTYGIMYAKHNQDFVFGWDTVYTMSPKEIAKYKDGGIKLGILRVGTTANIYLDGELVHSENLAAVGIGSEETVKIGLEAFYFNQTPQQIAYEIHDQNVDSVTLNKVKYEGGTVAFDDDYKVGDSVVLVLNKSESNYVLLSLLVNGMEMSGDVETEDGTDILTIAANASRVLNVEVVYGAAQDITANITIDSELRAEGVVFTFTNAADNTIVKTATVANNKMTIENMKQGRYLVSTEVFGKTIDLGSYSVVSTAEKKLQVENVFIDGKKLDLSVIDLFTGSFVYHSAFNEDYSIKIDETGDAFLAVKIKLDSKYKAQFKTSGEVSFGMYMTVKDAQNKLSTHWTNIWLKNANGEDLFKIRTDFGWDESVCVPFAAKMDTNKYSKALFGDGLYVVIRYKSETGVMETYLGENDFGVTYLRDWNDANNLFPINGTVVKAGFRDDLGWGGTSVDVNISGFRYGKTLLQALGATGSVTLEDQSQGGTVALSGTPNVGEDVTLTMTPNDGKRLDRITVNGVDLTESIKTDGTLVIKKCTVAKLVVAAEFVDLQRVDSLEVSITGKKYGATDNVANGKTATLSRGSFTYTGTISNGKITFQNVVAMGGYTLSVEGFIAKTGLTVPEDGNVGAITLEYNLLHAGSHQGTDWNGNYGDVSKVDKSHVNDENPYFVVNGTDLYQYTVDTYDDVMASMTVKASMTNNNPTLALVFDGKKAVMVRIERQDNGSKYKVQWIGGNNWEESSINSNWDFGSGEASYNPISAALKTKYENDGLKLTLVRKGDIVLAYVDGVFAAYQKISGYGGKTCRVAFAIAGVSGTQTIPFEVSATIPSVTITDATAADANGTISVSSNNVLGGTVTVTVTPSEGYMLDNLTVSGGVNPVKTSENVYTFLATNEAHTVVATFASLPTYEETISISAIGLNNTAVVDSELNGKTITFTPAERTPTSLTIQNKQAKARFLPGEYTVALEGYYDLKITIGNDGHSDKTSLEFIKKIFGYNLVGEGYDFANQSQVDNTQAAKEGYIVTTQTSTKYVYEFTCEAYMDIAFTITVKKDSAGNQGIIMREYNPTTKVGTQRGLRVRIEKTANPKAQWWGGEWGWGIQSIWDKWDFGSGEYYANPLPQSAMNKYNGDGVTLTLVRKGNTVYALVDGKIYGAAALGSWSDKYFQFAICAENAVKGYQIPFKIENADTVLARAAAAIGDTGVTSYIGTWTAGSDASNPTLAVSGRGYATFTAPENTVKERVTFKLKANNATGDQGIMYRFNDGKYVAVRYQGGNSKHIQYSCDTTLFGDNWLVGWGNDYVLNDNEKNAADGDGIDFTFVRDGKKLSVYIGNRLLNERDLDEKYATMSGEMSLIIWGGSNVAFTYSHTTGTDVALPSTET